MTCVEFGRLFDGETFWQMARPFKRPGAPKSKPNLQESSDEAQVPSKECAVVAERRRSALPDCVASESASAGRGRGASGTDEASSIRGHLPRQGGFCLRWRPVDCLARRRSSAAADFARWGRTLPEVFAGRKMDRVYGGIRRQPGCVLDFVGGRRAETADVPPFERHRAGL